MGSHFIPELSSHSSCLGLLCAEHLRSWEDRGLIASPHDSTHRPVTPVPGHSVPLSDLCWYQACMWSTDVCQTKHSHTLNNKEMVLKSKILVILFTYLLCFLVLGKLYDRVTSPTLTDLL